MTASELDVYKVRAHMWDISIHMTASESWTCTTSGPISKRILEIGPDLVHVELLEAVIQSLVVAKVEAKCVELILPVPVALGHELEIAVDLHTHTNTQTHTHTDTHTQTHTHIHTHT